MVAKNKLIKHMNMDHKHVFLTAAKSKHFTGRRLWHGND